MDGTRETQILFPGKVFHFIFPDSPKHTHLEAFLVSHWLLPSFILQTILALRWEELPLCSTPISSYWDLAPTLRSMKSKWRMKCMSKLQSDLPEFTQAVYNRAKTQGQLSRFPVPASDHFLDSSNPFWKRIHYIFSTSQVKFQILCCISCEIVVSLSFPSHTWRHLQLAALFILLW